MESSRPATGGRVGEALPIVYLLFFLSGFTALVFQILWSRRFVTVFGNSSYAISVVLCAYMAGLGFGSWLGGRLADRTRRWLLLYAGIQGVVGVWALLIPVLLAGLRRWVPQISLLAPDQSLLISSSLRFLISLAILFLPCTLMGATLPVLVRYCSESRNVVGSRVGSLYGINTVGAAMGSFVAGYWMLEVFGLSVTNRAAAGVNVLLAGSAALLASRFGATAAEESVEPSPSVEEKEAETASAGRRRRVLLVVAFATGTAGLSCEVLWTRYLAFFKHISYVFTTLLMLFLLGLGLGSLLYRLLLAGRTDPLKLLSRVLLLLGAAVPACFALGAYLYSSGRLPLDPYCFKVAAVTAVLPTMLMGAAFPLICAAYNPELERAGRGVGTLAALNTAGSVVGALLPVFVLVPLFGISNSIMLMSGLYLGMGVVLALMVAGRWRQRATAGAMAGLAVLIIALAAPADLVRAVFLHRTERLPLEPEIIFWEEGRTATSVVVRDRETGQKWIMINGTAEVPTTRAALACFKLLGTVGPLLHPDPDDVFIIAVGGGIAAGATLQHPGVESIEIVDIESTVIQAARLLGEYNHDLLDDSRVEVVINDGRNQLLMSPRKWPVIICDSTHPKASDSWVLYTQEFYRLARQHLEDGGVFVQWVPVHGLTPAELKGIVATFQSIFPHASAWISAATDKRGATEFYVLLVATEDELQIDVQALKGQLDDPALQADLRPYDLGKPFGLLASFLSGEDGLESWAKGVPLNTDDLPWTYYDTALSRGEPCDLRTLASLVRSPAPYLENADERLLAKLERTARTRKLAWLIEPGKELRQVDKRRLLQMADLLSDDPAMLNQLAADVAGLRGGAALATKIYQKVVSAHPENLRAHKGLGDLLLQMDMVEQAQRHFRRAVDSSPDDPGANAGLAVSLARGGRLNAAETHYRKAIENRPDHPGYHYGLGTVMARQDRPEEAAASFGRAVELRPRWVAARYNLAVALARTGHLPDAIDHLQKVLDMRPDHRRARQALTALRTGGNAPPP